jgi:excisionase family DNA binding protein
MNPAGKIKILRPDQAGERLKISRSGVYRLLSEGQLRGLKVRGSVRVVESSIDDYLQRQICAFALENGEPETVSDSPNGPRISGSRQSDGA